MTVLTFPSNPIEGQQYAAPNGIQYVFDGVKWIVESTSSSSAAVTNSTQDRVAPMFVDGDNQGISFTYNAETNTLAATVTAVNGDSLVNGIQSFTLESDGSLTAPYGKLGVTPQEEFGISADVDTAAVIKSNDGAHKWIFGIDGKLTVPGSSPYATSGGMTIQNQYQDGTTYLDGNGNDITLQVNATKTIYIKVGTAQWSFGDAGIGPDPILRLPVGGDIVDSTGSSVLGGGASTGNISFINDDIYNLNGITIENADLTHGATAAVIIPGNGSTNPVQVNNTYGPVIITSGINGAGQQWNFRGDGALRNNNSFTKTSMSGIYTTSPTVVWTASEDFISGVKLQIQVESFENGDSTGWHSQVCEAIIASRGYASVYGGPGGDPVMTVYGVTHTSTVPLVTFTVQRNPTTKFIEVVGTLTAAANPASADLRIYSVETATRD